MCAGDKYGLTRVTMLESGLGIMCIQIQRFSEAKYRDEYPLLAPNSLAAALFWL